ncbi:MAG: S46 family peptidase [Bacteroidia bacterium]
MWLPLLLEQLNQKDMEMKGFQLKAEDVYSINHSSMKDGVVQFGGGCTAELISGKGLLLTNHHCGFGQIQAHSTLEHDYLLNGFWAAKAADELPNPGLTVTFIVRMEDVTARVLANMPASPSETVRDSIIKVNSVLAGKEAIKGTHYEAFIRAFYNGNQYFMFVTETFKDIRLVGAPPSSIGKFGADADNWVWPRHTGDFSIFRIYANKNNEPAEYSPDNIPYTPKYFFPVSLQGVQEGDFTMVYGFPARSNEYLCSKAVDLIQNVSDPARVKIRRTRLDVMDRDMRASEKVHIQYASKQSGVANAWKKWDGEMGGLARYKEIEKKRAQEALFQGKVNHSGDKFKAYTTLLPQLYAMYDSMKYIQLNFDCFNEVAGGIEAVRYCGGFENLLKASEQKSPVDADLKKQLQTVKDALPGFFKDYNMPTDQAICASLLKLYTTLVPESLQPGIFKIIRSKYKGDFDAYAAAVYSKSIFTHPDRLTKMLDSYKAGDAKKFRKDPVSLLTKSLYDMYFKDIIPTYTRLNKKLDVLNRQYMQAQLDVLPDKKYYPDANFTLRVAYGNIRPYEARDAVSYKWFTTLDGIMQKEDSTIEEFRVDPKLKSLWQKKDYGSFADKDGSLHVAFIANNHTSGGNSGSPVIDGKGRLIGLNFDRCWEGTMSDVAFDPSFCRNISVDVRYVLFVVDKIGGAGYLLEEMKLVR